MNRRNGWVTMWLVANIISQSMFLVGIALMTAILLRRWHRYYRRKRPKSQSATQRSKSRVPIRSLSDAPDEVLRWEVELHDTARALMGELDSKMRVLQILIRQAQEEAERLEGLIDGANSSLDSQVQTPSSDQGSAKE